MGEETTLFYCEFERNHVETPTVRKEKRGHAHVEWSFVEGEVQIVVSSELNLSLIHI